MGFFPCCGNSSVNSPERTRSSEARRDDQPSASSDTPRVPVRPYKGKKKEESKPRNEGPSSEGENDRASGSGQTEGTKGKVFKLAELVAATDNFKSDYILGEGGFGKVYKGHLKSSDQIVAIKQLNPDGCQGLREYIVEAMTLSLADHPNLVELVGYCGEGNQLLLVYEYMPLGSLEDHLHDPEPNRRSLDWNTRMKIAVGAARGLEYLHNKMQPPMIYRDMKSSNILLGEGYHPKLSDFGLAKVGPTGDQTHVSTRVMGTYGYCAPEYAETGQLTFKSDIYSFGVVLLELITGRKAIDDSRPSAEQVLVEWIRQFLNDEKKFHRMADPALEGRYPAKGLYRAVTIAALCVQDKPRKRPVAADIVNALDFVASQTYDPQIHPGERSRQPSPKPGSD